MAAILGLAFLVGWFAYRLGWATRNGEWLAIVEQSTREAMDELAKPPATGSDLLGEL